MASKNEKTNQPREVAFSFRLEPALAQQLKTLADQQRRSYGNMIALLLEEALKAKTA